MKQSNDILPQLYFLLLSFLQVQNILSNQHRERYLLHETGSFQHNVSRCRFSH